MDLSTLTLADLEAHRAEFAAGLDFTQRALAQSLYRREQSQVKLRTYECALACMDAEIARRKRSEGLDELARLSQETGEYA